MNQFQYVVTLYTADFEQEVRTNDPRIAIQTALDFAGTGCHVDVINGFTGEVLVCANHPEPYMQEDFNLMVLGYLMEKFWG
jgi:hypothetical protein